MTPLNVALDWMAKLRDKYGEEKAMKIISGFSDVYSVLAKQDEEVRNNILSLFVEIGEGIRKDIP